MSALLLIPDAEESVIDNMRYKASAIAPVVTQPGGIGVELMTVGENRPAPLPDASVGGQNGSGHIVGYSTGFVGYRQSHQPFMGSIIQVPQEQLVHQGNVGATNRAGRLYAGVMDQLTQYTPSQADYASSYVGPVYSAQMVTTNGK